MNDYEIKSQNILKIEIMWLINREKKKLKKVRNHESRRSIDFASTPAPK